MDGEARHAALGQEILTDIKAVLHLDLQIVAGDRVQSVVKVAQPTAVSRAGNSNFRRSNEWSQISPFRWIWVLQEPDFSLVGSANPCALRVHARVEKSEIGAYRGENRVHAMWPSWMMS